MNPKVKENIAAAEKVAKIVTALEDLHGQVKNLKAVRALKMSKDRADSAKKALKQHLQAARVAERILRREIALQNYILTKWME